jgi:hypothetical protein
MSAAQPPPTQSVDEILKKLVDDIRLLIINSSVIAAAKEQQLDQSKIQDITQTLTIPQTTITGSLSKIITSLNTDSLKTPIKPETLKEVKQVIDNNGITVDDVIKQLNSTMPTGAESKVYTDILNVADIKAALEGQQPPQPPAGGGKRHKKGRRMRGGADVATNVTYQQADSYDMGSIYNVSGLITTNRDVLGNALENVTELSRVPQPYSAGADNSINVSTDMLSTVVPQVGTRYVGGSKHPKRRAK